MAVVNQVDKYHLQLRDGDPIIGAVGKIGCFGGKVDKSEIGNEKQTVARELAEETNLVLKPEDFRYLNTVEVESDHQLEPVLVQAKVYQVLIPYGFEVIAKEGQLVSWTGKEIREHMDELTPATKAFFTGYF